jgi:hypothetical protein
MTFLHTQGRCELTGGPLDGARFGDLPIFEGGLAPSTLSCPLAQPAELSLYGDYARRDDHPVDGFWVYVFTGLSGPGPDALVAERAQQGSGAS